MKIVITFIKYALLYTLIPLILLASIELFLRYKGWGENIFPWKETVIENRRIYTKNLAFYQQFFDNPVNPGEFPPYINFVSLPKQKNTKHIFVLGESAAIGWPDSRFSFGRYLETILNRLYPEYNWHTVNIAFAGINSHILRYVARKSTFLKPDLVLLYMGNNEAHGTFSIYHSFRKSTPLPPWIVQPYINLQNLYLFQNIEKLAILFRKKYGNIFNFSTKDVRFDNPEVKIVEASYEKNLHAIIETFTKNNIPVFVGTLSSNLRDFPPVDSWFRENITENELKKWIMNFESGFESLTSTNIDEAKKSFQQAIEIDNTPAILNYFLGWCYLAEKNIEEARKYFVSAREKDGFGFVRAKSFINNIVAETVNNYPPEKKVVLVDAEKEVSQYSHYSVPGNEVFVDSCHLNLYGNYILSTAYLKKIINTLNLPERKIPTFDEIKLDMGITKSLEIELNIFNRSDIQISVIHFPTEEKAKDFNNTLKILKQTYIEKKSSEKPNVDSFEILFKCANDDRNKQNLVLELNYLEGLQSLGAFKEGINRLQYLCNTFPDNLNLFFMLFEFACYADDDKIMNEMVEKVKNLAKMDEVANYYLLKWALKKGSIEDSIEISKKIISFPLAYSNYKALAQAILINHQEGLSFSQKLEEWKQVLQKSPWSWDVYDYIYQQAKSPDEKISYRNMLIDLSSKIDKCPSLFSFLSFIYEDEDDIQKSIEMLRKAIEIAPNNASYSYELARLLTKQADQLLLQSEIDTANQIYQSATQNFPYYAPAWLGLIDTCSLMDDMEGFIEKINEWQEIQNREAMQYLWEIIF